MLSTCPHCLEQINHDDSLFEVECSSCHQKFNPFLSPSDIPNDLGLMSNDAESAGGGEAAGNDGGLGGLSLDSDVSAASPEGLAESSSVFEELRDFGENLIPGEAPPEGGEVEAAPEPPPMPKKAAPSAPKVTLPSGPIGDALMTTADQIAGFQIEAHLPPISAWCDLAADPENPLKPGFDALWTQATAMGANAIVSVRWKMHPDGSRCVLSGTPVRGSSST